MIFKYRFEDSSKSWYKPDFSSLTYAQRKYCELLMNGFCMKDPMGNPIPYIMTDYQKEFHANSFNVLLEDAEHILFDKARGVSFTYSSLIELIMTGVNDSFQDLLIPLITHREKNSIEILNHAKWLIQNCKIKEVRENAKFTDASTDIYFTNTKSKIQVFPSGDAADAIRGNRLLRGLIDEYAFQRNQKKLWAAANSTMRSGVGQWIIGSTPNGKNNMYYDLTSKAKKGEANFKYFYLPVFNPQKFDVNKTIPEQDLISIAPWIDIKKLESDRLADDKVFLQENMCDTLDTNTTLIKYNDILKVSNKKLVNHKDYWLQNPAYQYVTKNNIYAAIDVAKSKDFFSVSAFEEVWVKGKVYLVQRWLDYFTGVSTPELEDYSRKFIMVFPSLKKLRIDKTGIGEYLPEYLKKDFKSLIVPIDFRWKIKVGGSGGVNNVKTNKISIRNVMAFNHKKLVENKTVFLIYDKMQINHLNSVNYALEIQRNKGEEKNSGHGDIFWSNAMALLDFTDVKTNKVISTTKYGGEDVDISKFKETGKWEDVNIMNRLNFYKKYGKK